MDSAKTSCLIIGGGAAGLSAGISFLNSTSSGKCIIAGSQLTNSSLSPWNIRKADKEKLKNNIMAGGDNLSDEALLETYVENYENCLDFMEDLGIEFEESNLGIIPIDQNTALNKFYENFQNNERAELKNVKVKKLLLNDEGNIRGVKAKLKDGSTESIIADQVIIASGGLSNLFKYTSGFKSDKLPLITALCFEAGLEVDNLEFMMYHPFLVVDEKLPRALISGTILQQARFYNSDGEMFLSEEIRYALRNNQHHDKFGQMTREFYRESLKSELIADISEVSEEEFEQFKTENEYGWVFRGRDLEEIRKFKINPTFHYSLGGLVTDERTETNQENVYAVGEASTGLHGSNRIGGTAIPEAVIFGRIAGEEAAKNSSEPEEKITEEIGNSKINDELREKVWKALGPVKHQKTLNEFLDELKSKSNLCSEEKFLVEVLNSVLSREENIGSHYIGRGRE